jgi:hypothetical protein
LREFDGLCESVGRVVNAVYRTEKMQYQKYNLQLGMCDTKNPYDMRVGVFEVPFMNYSRLTHMTNCYRVGLDWFESSRVGRGTFPKYTGELLIASYVHDIGQGHTSHALEKIGNFDHEVNGRRIVLSDEIAPLIEKEGFDPKKVTDIFCGKLGDYSRMMDTWIDRVTYVTDDSRASGYVGKDYYNLIRAIYFEDDGYFVLDGEFVDVDVRDLLSQRATLIDQVYGGMPNRSMTTMYKSCFRQGLDEGVITFDDAMYSVLPQQYNMLGNMKDERLRVVNGFLKKTYPFYGVMFYADEDKVDDVKNKKQSFEWRRGVEGEIERRLGGGCITLVDQANLPKRSKLDFEMMQDGELLPAKKALKFDCEGAIDVSEREFWVFFDPKTHDRESDKALEKTVLDSVGIDIIPTIYS